MKEEQENNLYIEFLLFVQIFGFKKFFFFFPIDRWGMKVCNWYEVTS